MTDLSDFDTIREVAHALADAARAATLAHFRTPLSIESKGTAFDPVTRADREAEAAMRAILAERRPDDAILGEETGATTGTSGLTWVLDPIDGTRAFISGMPTWGVLIGLSDADGPRYGIVDQPFTGERFEGGPHGATWSRGGVTRPIGVRETARLSDATLLTTFPEVGTREEGASFARVSAACRLTRYGLDCYGYALVAAGHVDLVIEAGLQPYDVAAPIALIQAAGGVVTDWTGAPAHEGGRIVAAATPALHQAALKLLNG
ncbi:Histidinol-phosphatase [Jannaschia seosinensis]|uniref:Histidinol-phosphatase n=1 Tax=Jannaschia seosinensis TaxID=313367 RepID=A0A0M7B7T7_9RHOB|nr:histidinol-phosphatase [Jannaschia seosinensis]CUH07330.1 Histidinol-phosphatase [Jannaschia seosinensis]